MSWGYSYPNLSIQVITEDPYTDALGNYPFFATFDVLDDSGSSAGDLFVLITLKVVTCIGSTWTSK